MVEEVRGHLATVSSENTVESRFHVYKHTQFARSPASRRLRTRLLPHVAKENTTDIIMYQNIHTTLARFGGGGVPHVVIVVVFDSMIRRRASRETEQKAQPASCWRWWR